MDTENSHNEFKFWVINYRTGRVTVTFQDGSCRQMDEDPGLRFDDSLVAATAFDWENWWIMTTTVRKDLIVTEGYNPNSPPALRGRPSVYLDQNHWRTVSDALNHPDKISKPSECKAALELADLVNDGRVVLLLSDGHLLETSRLDGDLKYEVGVTMARLTRGWQLREPIDLWKAEATSSIQSYLDHSSEASSRYAITTEPGALFNSDTNLALADDSTDWERFMAMIRMPTVILDRLTDPEPASKVPLLRWIETHQSINRQIQEAAKRQRLSKEQTARCARRRYWNENIKFYRDPYQRATGRIDSPTFSDQDLSALLNEQPMVGLLSNLFIQRLIGRDTRWTDNDLIDML